MNLSLKGKISGLFGSLTLGYAIKKPFPSFISSMELLPFSAILSILTENSKNSFMSFLNFKRFRFKAGFCVYDLDFAIFIICFYIQKIIKAIMNIAKSTKNDLLNLFKSP